MRRKAGDEKERRGGERKGGGSDNYCGSLLSSHACIQECLITHIAGGKPVFGVMQARHTTACAAIWREQKGREHWLCFHRRPFFSLLPTTGSQAGWPQTNITVSSHVPRWRASAWPPLSFCPPRHSFNGSAWAGPPLGLKCSRKGQRRTKRPQGLQYDPYAAWKSAPNTPLGTWDRALTYIAAVGGPTKRGTSTAFVAQIGTA